jgi:phosphoglycolate phosphatase
VSTKDKYRQSAILFDLDGTLIDTAPDFILAVNTQRARHCMEPLAEHIIRNTVSEGARALARLSFDYPLFDDQEEDARFIEKHQELLGLYTDHIADGSQLFPGMDNLLQWLEELGIPWGIVTNKPRRFTDPLLKGLALDGRVKAVVCPDEVTHTKPHPEPLYLACCILGADPQKSIYIGDHQRDIEAGQRAGMNTIAVSYGYIPATEDITLWEATYIRDSAMAIKALLQEILTPDVVTV